MPDITMCASKDCPERNNCYRACAKPSEFQSWSNFEYTCNEENGFKDFIKCYKKGWILVNNDKETTHEKLQKMWDDMTIYQKIKGYSLESLSDFFMKICNDNRSKFLTKEDWIKLLSMKSCKDCKTGKENIHIDKSN